MSDLLSAEQAAELLVDCISENSNSDTSDPEVFEEESDSHSVDSEQQEEQQNELMIASKDQKVLFSQVPYPTRRYTQQNIFKAIPGPKHTGNISEPGQFFKLFIDNFMVRKCVEYTNMYGQSQDPEFRQIDVSEFYKFVGLLIFIGVFSAKQENLEEVWSEEFGRPFVKKTMARNRFREIKRFIRFDNRAERVRSTRRARLDPIRDFWQAFLVKCKKHYQPESDITIDEMMIPFRGRCSFKMYMPAKPCKYGLKIFAAVELNSKYFYNARLYEGKIGNRPEFNQALNVCKELMDPLLNKGYNLCTDNFYTSFQLAQFLLSKKTTLVGTMRKNKPEIPPCLNTASRRHVLDKLYAYQRDLTVLSYVTKPSRRICLKLLPTTTR